MTATQVQPPPPPAHAPGRAAVPPLVVRARDMLASEWTKLRSVRSNYWTLLFAAVATIGSTVIVARALAITPHRLAGGPITPLTASFAGFAEYGVLPVIVLSVLTCTAEYSSGLIRTTFAAEPRRWAVLAAKAVVAGTVALVAGELIAFASFFVAQAILSAQHRGVSLSDPRSAQAVLAAGFFLAVCTLLGVGLGAIVRHVAGAIATAIGLIYLLAALCLALPAPWNDRIGRFTLAFSAYQEVAAHPQPSLLSPALSLLVLIAWPVITLLIAAVLITRRDP